MLHCAFFHSHLHSLIHSHLLSFIHYRLHSFIPSFIFSSDPSLNHIFSPTLIDLFIHSLTSSFTHSFIDTCTFPTRLQVYTLKHGFISVSCEMVEENNKSICCVAQRVPKQSMVNQTCSLHLNGETQFFRSCRLKFQSF